MANRRESRLLNWLVLYQLKGMGNKKMQKWLSVCPDSLMWFDQQKPSTQLLNFLSSERISTEFDFDAARHALEWEAQPDCHVILLSDKGYPSLLKEISDPPVCLFVQGDAQLLSEPQLAVVGSRHPSPSGKEHAYEFARALAREGFVITSGLAHGVDGLCHQGALACSKTIAVLGHGLHHLYPKSHKGLANQILEQGGALVSEYPLSVGPKPYHFPQRNRIVSGLSLGVVVIEASLKSGSLITASMALEQGREVFALPGSVDNPLSKGCNHLIRQGAKCVETLEHILEEMNPSIKGVLQAKKFEFAAKSKQKEVLSSKLKKLLAQIGFECTPIDRVVERSGLPVELVSSQLMELELEGKICLVPGGYVRV